MVLRAAGLAARTALLLPTLTVRLPDIETNRLQRIGRRAALLGATATLATKLAGGGLGLFALAYTLETSAAGVFGADFVLALAAAVLAVAVLGLLAWGAGAGPPAPLGSALRLRPETAAAVARRYSAFAAAGSG